MNFADWWIITLTFLVVLFILWVMWMSWKCPAKESEKRARRDEQRWLEVERMIHEQFGTVDSEPEPLEPTVQETAPKRRREDV